MDLTMKQHFTLLALPALILIHAHFAATASKQYTLPSFSDPNGWQFFRMVVDLNDDVFVGGNNVLHHFSPDLELKETFSLGPVMDHPNCTLPSYPCSAPKMPISNYVHALQLVYHLGPRPLLLVCGTAYRMLCQIRPVDNLNEYHWVQPYNQSVGYHSGWSVTHMYLGHGYDDQQTLFTATTIENTLKNIHLAPFLSSKVLQKDGDNYSFRYSFQNDTAKSAMEFSTWAEGEFSGCLGIRKDNGTSGTDAVHPSTRSSRSCSSKAIRAYWRRHPKGPRTNYFQATRTLKSGLMVHDGYIYFLISYTHGLIRYESRLVRVCTQDGTFQSYSELPIACNHTSGQLKRRSYAAHLEDSPSSNGKSIYVSFYRKYGEEQGSTLCIFPMTDVIRAFTTYPRDCLPAVGHTCEKEMKKDITDFCGSDAYPYAVRQPLVVSHFTFLPDSMVTAITTVKYNNEMVAIVGDRSGYILKISLTSGQIISKNLAIDSDSIHEIRNPFVFDRSHQHIYLLKANKIVKFPVASCRVHESCESCFTEGRLDPLNCGWCGGHCAHLEECEDPDSFSRDTCTPSITEVSPQKGPIHGAVKIKIIGDNFGSYVFDRYYYVTVAGIPCEIVNWQNTEITCILGPAPEKKSGPVVLHVFNPSSSGYNVVGSTSNQFNFSYYEEPRLFGIHPNKGPTSGGTHVSLFGENLDFEKSKDRHFIVRGRLCSLKGFTMTIAWCITGNETKLEYPDKIAIVVGNTTYVMDETPRSTINGTELYQSFEYSTVA